MTPQEAEVMFRRELDAAIDKARVNGVGDRDIGTHLRSIASNISNKEKAELERYKERMRKEGLESKS